MQVTPFQDIGFDRLPGWAEADCGPALEAFRRSAPRLLSGDVRCGSLGIRPQDFGPAARAAMAFEGDAEDARTFFRRHFRPALLRPGPDRPKGFVTGYFEPVLPASRRRSDRFAAPLHARPADLVALGETGRPEGLPEGMAFARRLADGRLVEHFDRAAIARGALDGRDLELVWLENEIEAFFVHIQGSARLALEDGGAMRVGYAAKSGHAYASIGRVLVEAGELTLEEADMAGLRRWLASNPGRIREILDRNRSYIFFAASEIVDETAGPVGAAQVPLTPLGSIALDHHFHTFGLPVLVDAPGLGDTGLPGARLLLVAQDTGSAIVGPARGDVFVGSGDAAGRIAGRIRHEADLYALLPRAER